MADYFPGSICIGGSLPCDRVLALCEALDAAGLSRDWNEGTRLFPGGIPGDPEACAATLLAARDPAGHVWLCDSQAAYGEFLELEEALQHLGLAYNRESDARYESDATLVRFRPGLGLFSCHVTQNSQPLVPTSELVTVLAEFPALPLAPDTPAEDATGTLHHTLEALQARLRALAQLDLPALPPLTIAEPSTPTPSATPPGPQPPAAPSTSPLTLSAATLERIDAELTRWSETTDIDGDNAVAMADLLREITRAAHAGEPA